MSIWLHEKHRLESNNNLFEHKTKKLSLNEFRKQNTLFLVESKTCHNIYHDLLFFAFHSSTNFA